MAGAANVLLLSTKLAQFAVVSRGGTFADEFALRHMSRHWWWCPQIWSNVYEMHIPTIQTNIHSAHALASCVSEPASAASALARQ